MLNRTNRTQSATNSGLNLGTRSFATLASANLDGKTTLRFPARLALVRVGVWEVGGDIGVGAIDQRSYPPQPMASSMAHPTGSSPRSPWTSLGLRPSPLVTRTEPQGQTPELAIATGARRSEQRATHPDHEPKPVLGALGCPSLRFPRAFALTNPQSPCRFLVPDIRP